ncbi:hypothetical protein ACP70R_000733 [Stipagrostis hirtigluma subsp. patula]
MAAPVELIDDAIAEILLRLPPDEPACLVRASLVCKPWRRILSDPAFIRRYREFHRSPPLLAFLHNIYDDGSIARIVPTTSPSPFSQPALDCRNWWIVECRHGRALLNSFDRLAPTGLIVWDPITGEQQHVPVPEYPDLYYTAAVLCGSEGCHHLDCHGGPFLVVFVGTHHEEDTDVTWASIYSSETSTWSPSISIQLDSYIEERPSLLTGGALYFSLEQGKRILKLDLVRHGLCVIDAPDVYEQPEGIVVTAEDGGLGFAGVKDGSLYLWSGQVSPDGIAGWVQGRVIKLKTLLPILGPLASLHVIGFVEGTDIIFMSTDIGVFTIMLKSEQVRKVGERGSYYAIVPYMSFYTPDLAKGRLTST